MVNAHTHLDLTTVGPYELGRGDFPRFLNHVRTHRPSTPDAIAHAVRLGIDLSLAGGVVAVGDIAGCPPSGPSAVPFHALAESPLAGITYIEFFGIGPRDLDRCRAALDTVAALAPTTHVRPGLSPHAPYTVSPRAYRAALDFAARHRLPLTTHLAESAAEREFIAQGTGPHRALLEAIGLWSDDLLADYARGNTPIAHLAPLLDEFAHAKPLAVHANDIPDADLPRLKGPLAFCPRSSAYFAAERDFGPHRYTDLLAAGVNVCLGTDSIINLPARAADPAQGGISVLDEARFLYRRDRTPPATLLRMMTTAAADALSLPAADYRFAPPGEPCAPRALVLVETSQFQHDPLVSVLAGETRPELLFLRN
jgi:cytosine/adenosine deaminase-related metal-dependent hydrolase